MVCNVLKSNMMFGSVYGPSSYELGSAGYEDNIITDCFGASRLEEYRGKHMLDVLLVYGAEEAVLTQVHTGPPCCPQTLAVNLQFVLTC